ncbi:LOW QUALITY PROTEIN: BEACH domain-containing protein B-like [Phoenix dactylifera]|uniref:LOW QUALITY PROTEIN: BEACH domain-containing protein B-like n=1 Tax=Phoenix dactylifera TaxID=42345 RepID=A0A8B9AYM0_PHODC|nr:LOW QUALITY PROTEIN: BEACH domain-containing protein B-like [Phoenix dactylifera]
MNIVKGVADLIKRSSGGQTGEGGSWAHADKLSAPSPRFRFRDVGEEAVLSTLWQRYENAIDKTEKRKLLQVFLLHFIQTYKNWEPVHGGQLPAEQASGSEEIILGCSTGHPSEVILILIQQIARISSLVTELNNSAAQANADLSEPSARLTFSTEALYVLNCLTIITRSVHNCKVFSYYGGVQKIIALLKAAVVQLKTLTSALAVDEQLSSSSVEKTRTLQKLLVYVVSVVFVFVELHSSATMKNQFVDIVKYLPSKDNLLVVPSSNPKSLISEKKLDWQQKAIVLVMEAGGVNWLVELLRVIRRLNLKEQWTDLSLHYLALGTLRSALSENPRAQNHFRSIGGLEVLMDGLGLPSSQCLVSKHTILSGDERSGIFRLQILSLEVLRESIFGNLNNMQFLYENGRIHKFANSICWPAFTLQELNQQMMSSSMRESQVINLNSTKNSTERILSAETSVQDETYYLNITEWKAYSIKLSRALCSFLLAPEDIDFHHGQASVGQSSLPISLAYWELSIRWVVKVLLTVFPCIKACANERQLPNHIRIVANTLQHYILCAFRKVLVSAPALLETFREERIWDLIFSEKFFYFRPSSEEVDAEIDAQGDSVLVKSELPSTTESSKDQAKPIKVDILQVEAISFLEFVATLSGNTNNLPECCVLLDTLEQSACNPEIAIILVKSLYRILQLAVEESLASFKPLNAIARVLKVACIQAQELRKLTYLSLLAEDEFNEGSKFKRDWTPSSVETAENWIICMKSSFELFTEYLRIAENGKKFVLHNSNCIDCLFDLFWEENLRKPVLEQILGLFKLPPSSAEDHTAKLQLCSKFLETFTRAKEREKCFVELSIDLLISMREIILIDKAYFQSLFRSGECFLHIVSLLNGTLDERIGEQLVLNVLQTLTLLLTGNDDSKVAFRALVGVGYQTLQSLLLDFCKWQSSDGLLTALLDMLVDGRFDMKKRTVIKNEDVIILFLNVLQKSSTSLQHYGLDVFQSLLKDSIVNRTSCFRAGILSFLLDWFSVEEREDIIAKIAKLIQIIGGHSISGKDIRKIFALLRSERIGYAQKCSLLLTSVHYMLKEKGPEAFFEFSGQDSGIVIKTPVQWPYNKGFSFSCWLRIEDFHESGIMGLFSFLTDNGRGCLAMLDKGMLIFESVNQKRQSILLPVNLFPKKWHFLCITHSIGRAFSGGSLLRCYVDGDLISSEKCRYAKVSEVMTRCTIGMELRPADEELHSFKFGKIFPFFGQIGPVYVFGDALSSEQVRGIYCLGPSYMYSFLGDEVLLASDNSLCNGVLDAKDGLSAKIIFGLNAQASDGRSLFNVSLMLDNSSEKNLFEAIVMDGTKLCSRRLLQEIIYCVGGVSVFFPFLTQFDRSETDNGQFDYSLIRSITSDKCAAEVIELVASVLDGNFPNQQQMLLLSGFSILGFLFQSVPLQQLNMETLSALKNMFDVLRNCGMSEMLLKDAMLGIYLNPHIWVFANYEVQRDLYMFLIQYFENNRALLPTLCGLPRILDIICQFYWDQADSRTAVGAKPLLHPVTKQVIGMRPGLEEVHKIRLLLLSLAEMSLMQKISPPDIKALIAFFERSQDMVCIEDVLHMVIRALSEKPLLASFLDQVNLLGGCHIFINLLQRELETIRLLGLQFLGKLLVGLPSEKKGTKFFSLSVGRSKSLSDSQKKGGTTRLQPIFSAISERIFKFPLSDHLCATLFDVLLGGASPKQVLQKHSQSETLKNKKNSSTSFSSHFFLPQILVCVFKYLAICKDTSTREKILRDLLDLLDSNPSNIEALMEHGWASWLETSVRLDVFKNYKMVSKVQSDSSMINELVLVRNLYCVVLSHYLYSVKGGWHQLEETINFLLLKFEQGELLHQCLLRDIFEDIIGSLIELSSEENILISQPCRDNTLYLLKLIDELLIKESSDRLLFPGIGISLGFSSDGLQTESQKDISSAVTEILNLKDDDQLPRIPPTQLSTTGEFDEMIDEWWDLYDKTLILISEMNGKGPSKLLPKGSAVGGPSFGQRALGLVESLNIPASEMAAVVVSGGIGNVLGGKVNKYVDKAMLLRGEKCPRVLFHLVILYLCKASLESASRCVQQFISLLPSLLTSDDDQSRNKLHFFIWTLLAVRSQYGMLDDGARFHVISHLILETVSCGKSMLATSIMGRDDSVEVRSNTKEAGFIFNLIQRDRVFASAVDEAKYLRAIKDDRIKQLQEFHVKLDEHSLTEMNQWKTLEDEIQSNMNTILSSDDTRITVSRLAYDEDQQIIADKWIHVFRALIDERGPWSANPFPNNIVTHWKLDKTEDTWRRRLKLKRNYKFDEQLCHPSTTKLSSETSQPVSEFPTGSGANIPEKMKRFLLKGVRGIAEERNSEPSEHANDITTPIESSLNNSVDNQRSDYLKDCTDQVDNIQDKKELFTGTTDNDSSEVCLSVPCVLVTPKRKMAGHLAIMKNVLHFFGEFLVEGTGGSCVFNNFQDLRNSDSSKYDQMGGNQKEKLQKGSISLDADHGKGNAVNIMDSDASKYNQPNKIKRHRRWNVSKIKAVHLTRYLLQYTAIEVFFNDSIPPIFLNFASQKVAKQVGTLVVSFRNEFLFPKGSYRERNGIISFIDRRVAVEMAENVRESWRRREISNFEYVMILNTLAGRSYNDLTQYPVFPWVLADYSSETLDFNKSSTFRDLSKPVGALDLKRFQVFKDRYCNFCDPDIPSFYYGSHYSSMGIVLYYLLRLEPFTALHRSLQGGKFDHADRLFQSIEATYHNCLSNTSDVKELIPEFFYMPDFLVNSNSYHFGVKQDGEPLGDVALPPWAKGSPEEFIRRNREALESEYVSSNLHHWIDLVFGYKQRGRPAVEAANIFYYLTYEGAVDLENMDDILQKSAIEDQIANFGQTPIQIFRKKHPRRGPPIPIAHPLYFAPASITLTSITSIATNPPSALLFIGLLDSNIVMVNQGLTLSIKLWLTTQLQSGGNFTFSGSQEPFFGVGSDVLPPRKICTPLAENIEFGRQCLGTLQNLNENYLISCGNWDNSFQVISLNDGRIVQSIRQHRDVVSCLAVSSDGNILATGSYDTTVMVWQTYKGRSTERRSRSIQTELPRKDYVIIESPFHILCGHDDIITCLFVSTELDIVISGSKDGTCMFHTLREGTYVRSVQHPAGCALSKLVASQHGRLVIYADNDLSLHMYSINGKHIASSESNGRLSCIELSSCGDFLVCSGDHGQIILRSMHSLDVVRRYEGVGKIITSLVVTPEECFLAGTKDGNLLVYSIENPLLRKGSLSRNVKSKTSTAG